MTNYTRALFYLTGTTAALDIFLLSSRRIIRTFSVAPISRAFTISIASGCGFESCRMCAMNSANPHG
jgi:hypothetical protein